MFELKEEKDNGEETQSKENKVVFGVVFFVNKKITVDNRKQYKRKKDEFGADIGIKGKKKERKSKKYFPSFGNQKNIKTTHKEKRCGDHLIKCSANKNKPWINCCNTTDNKTCFFIK